MAEKKSKVLKQALIDLFDKNDSKVMKALKIIQENGSADEIPALMDVMVKSKEGPIKDELQKMLGSMKIAGGDEAMVSLLREERFKDYHQFILTSIWNLGYQPVEHLDVIVNAGLYGDYMTAFEVLTIIENLEPPFDMDVIAVASLNVDDHLEEEQDDERTPIFLQMKELLDKYKRAVSDIASD